jgi:hypothetical protein
MATNNMVPYSNPAGNNQTTPKTVGVAQSVLGKGVPGGPTTPVATNPLAPVAPSLGGVNKAQTTSVGGSVPTTNSASGATQNTVAPGGFITSNSSYSSGENDLQKQLTDIYGKGVGGSLYSLLSNMSGTNSTVLQEYIQSLQPQMAKAQANTNASLGAGGVSANSSVAGLADASLQAQETAAIAGESANLTQSQEQLTASLLSGMENKASAEVATSGWSTFGNVMGDISADVGAVLNGGTAATDTSKTGAASVPSNASIAATAASGNSQIAALSGASDTTDWGTVIGNAEAPFGGDSD